MLADTANSLMDALRDLELLDPARQQKLPALVQKCPTYRDLVRQLLEHKWLTPFQLHHLLKGKGQRLRVGPYVLLDQIGAGGMGEVFKARHRQLHRITAVKVLFPEHTRQESTLARFQREAEAAAHLSHPNIITIFDAGEDGDRHYLAMEYIEGIDLGRLLMEVGPLPVALACDCLRQAAQGLHHAHEADIVHRDIKPQNFLVAPRGGKLVEPVAVEQFAGGTVKVLDMGLVRLQQQRPGDSSLALTKLGVVLGTVDYLAPEQARNAHRVDRRADLYGLGCTLYHILAGNVPYPASTTYDRLMRHQTDPIPRLKDVRPDVPPELDAIVAKLLAKQPEERYQTAAEVARALKRIAERPESRIAPLLPGRPVYLEPTRLINSATEQADRPAPAPPERRRSNDELGWWIVAAIGALLLLRLFVWLVPGKPRWSMHDRPAIESIQAARTTPSPERPMAGSG